MKMTIRSLKVRSILEMRRMNSSINTAIERQKRIIQLLERLKQPDSGDTSDISAMLRDLDAQNGMSKMDVIGDINAKSLQFIYDLRDTQ